MTCKAEYEVRGSILMAVRCGTLEQFEGDVKLGFHLAPPIIAKRDPANGHLRKRRFGPWMMPALKLPAC